MKRKRAVICAVGLALAVTACKTNERENYRWLKKGLDAASEQLLMAAEEAEGTGKLPRSVWVGYDPGFLERQLGGSFAEFEDSLRPMPPADMIGKIRLCDITDWTSGFFPGSLWYAYEMTGNEELKERAIEYTNLLEPIRNYNRTHDIGFMINCSFGNYERIEHNETAMEVIKETADNLAGRFDPNIGSIRSWDFGKKKWNFPVIIDNMMNLELLFNASTMTGDSRYREIAVTHARTTIKNHFRPDYTSYHVVSYNDDGTVELKQTHQGQSDQSSWARGQAWAVYGYTVCYRETGDKVFLDQACNIARMIMERVKTADLVPLWDYDAPDTAETPRDASAAAITASAFIELGTLVQGGEVYTDYAERILKSLSGDRYLAKAGSNNGFVLMHSTGSLRNGSEIDVPLNYADYYYLEALKRYMEVKGISYRKL